MPNGVKIRIKLLTQEKKDGFDRRHGMVLLLMTIYYGGRN
jgi:hypothetical protein